MKRSFNKMLVPKTAPNRIFFLLHVRNQTAGTKRLIFGTPSFRVRILTKIMSIFTCDEQKTIDLLFRLPITPSPPATLPTYRRLQTPPEKKGIIAPRKHQLKMEKEKNRIDSVRVFFFLYFSLFFT